MKPVTITLDEETWREVVSFLEENTQETVRFTSIKEANSYYSRDIAIRAIRNEVPKRRRHSKDSEIISAKEGLGL